MSDREFGRFLASTAKDTDLAKAFVLAVGDRQGDDAIEAVAAFAQSRGYNVEVDDAARVRRSLIAASDTNRDLEDDELAGVDGGIVLETAIGVGIGVGILAASGAVLGGLGVATAVGIGSQIPEVSDWFKQW